MVKKITGEQMSLAINDEAAKELSEDVRYGVGTPIETRIAAALLEGAANTKALSGKVTDLEDLIAKQTTEMNRTNAVYCLAVDDLKENIEKIEDMTTLVTRVIDDNNTLHEGIVEHTTELFREELLEDLASKITASASDSLRYTRQEAEEAIRKLKEVESQRLAAEASMRETARTLTGLASNPAKLLPAKRLCAAVIVLLLISSISSFLCLATIKPIVEGNVVISYAEGYKDELAQVRADLAKTQNELDAFKAEYPEGLGRARLHELNLKNSQL